MRDELMVVQELGNRAPKLTSTVAMNQSNAGDLGEQRFVRIHKSTAVNLAEVASLSPLFKGDHEVRLRSGTVLRLSRRFKDALFGRMPG